MNKQFWVELKVLVPSEFVEPMMELFLKYGKTTPFIEEMGGFNPDEGEMPLSNSPVKVTAYIKNDKHAQNIREQIEVGVRLLALIGSVSPLEVRTVRASEWERAWRLYHKAFRIGKNIVVCPLGQKFIPTASDVLVRLDPGLAFGTGFHPTTAMCLEELESRVLAGSKVLDLGCGSGILSVASERLGAGEIIAMDIEEQAVRASKKNIGLNDLGEKIKVIQGTLPNERLNKVDILVANISAKVLIELARPMTSILAPEGILIASGFLDERFDDVIQSFDEAGLSLIKRRNVEDWVTLVLSPRPLRSISGSPSSN